MTDDLKSVPGFNGLATIIDDGIKDGSLTIDPIGITSPSLLDEWVEANRRKIQVMNMQIHRDCIGEEE